MAALGLIKDFIKYFKMIIYKLQYNNTYAVLVIKI